MPADHPPQPVRKDRPIIFSAPMIRALLDGRKTMTRRLLKIRGHRTFSEFGASDTRGYDWHFRDAGMRWHDLRDAQLRDRLAYRPADRLWAREAWATVNTYSGPGWAFRADGDFFQPEYDGPDEGGGPSFNYEKHPGSYSMWISDLMAGAEGHSWKSPIHMPRWASRLTLTITDVKVERIQNISEEDARAEGILYVPGHGELAPAELAEGYANFVNSRQGFELLWDELHGPGAWDANPWVVALTFSVERRNIDDEIANAE